MSEPLNLKSNIERLQKAFNLTTKKIRSMLIDEDSGLTEPQFFALYHLDHKGKCTVTELAQDIHVKPSAITVMIDRLLQNGLVLRERDKTDRRVVYIQLSPVGVEVFNKAKTRRKEIVQWYFNHLKPEEIQCLVDIFEKLATVEI